MKKLHERDHTIGINVELNEGEGSLLCSNESGKPFPSLDFLDTSSDDVTEDMILQYLAGIISNIYLKEMYGDKESSNLLPGINKRTG
ncbi:MAG: hypothetical protein JWQ09_492 [Segetibacter sp.]|nr:hypothetical protein [Segetibacter sp.]